MIDTLFGWTGEGAPWGGAKGVDQTRFDAQAYFEYGLTDDWTVFGQTAFESYALGPPTPNVYHGLDYSDIGVRRKLWSTGQWVFSGEATLFVPGPITLPRRPRRATPAGQERGGCSRGRTSASADGRASSTPSSATACAPPARRTNGTAI